MLKTVKEISQELSIKLGDKVSSGDSDGEIFSSDLRLGYINRAYGKLIRVLRSLMRNQAPEFTKVVDYVSVSGQGTGLTGYSNVYELDSYVKIIDVYAAIKKADNVANDNQMGIESPLHIEGNINRYPFYKAEKMNPEEFLNVIMKKNTFRTPSFEEGKIYYAVLNKKLYFLPQSNANYSYEGYYMTMIGNPENLKLESKLYITNLYMDLLITFAAYEGMMDIARSDKVQLYGQEIVNQLQILGQYAQLEQREEGISEQKSE